MVVVQQGDYITSERLTVESESPGAMRGVREPRDANVVRGLPVAIMEGEGVPRLGEAGGKSQLIAFQIHAQQGFEQELTRAALSTGGRAESKFLSLPPARTLSNLLRLRTAALRLRLRLCRAVLIASLQFLCAG